MHREEAIQNGKVYMPTFWVNNKMVYTCMVSKINGMVKLVKRIHNQTNVLESTAERKKLKKDFFFF